MEEIKNYFENSINNYGFDQIIKEIQKTYKTNNNLIFAFKKRLDFNDLTIKLTYKKKTILNSSNSALTFYIEIDKIFPNSVPIVKLVTNVILKFS